MSADGRELKCLLLPIQGIGVLVPNIAVAEIITQQDVMPRQDSPDWFLGMGGWRGQQIPLIAFDRLCRLRDDTPPAAGRFVVLFAPDSGIQPAYFGLRIEALPRSETVNEERLKPADRLDGDSEFIAARARLGDRDCIVPDVDAVLRAVAPHAVEQARAERQSG